MLQSIRPIAGAIAAAVCVILLFADPGQGQAGTAPGADSSQPPPVQVNTVKHSDGGYEVRTRYADRIEIATYHPNGLIRSRSVGPVWNADDAPPSEGLAYAAASVLVAAESELSRIWPGYWREDHAFGIYPVNGGTMVVFPPNEDGPGVPLAADDLPMEILGRAYLVEGVPSGPFVLDFPAGEKTIASVMVLPPFAQPQSRTEHAAWLADPVASLVMFVAHEGFHTHQIATFVPVPGGSPMADMVPVTPFRDLIDEPSIKNALEAERNVLRTALLNVGEADAPAAIAAYLDLKERRLGQMPPAFLDFENAHERMEGVAQWVGYHAVERAFALEPGSTLALIVADLGGRAGDGPTDGWDGYREWHLYTAGAAKAELLARLGPEEWQADLEGGAVLDDLLRRLVR